VNLIGEHVDYNGGRCLPIALTRTTSAMVSRRGDGLVRVRSGERSWTGSLDELDRVEGADRWVLYVAGVLLALDVRAGLDIDISSDVPVGAGLSSSAALECSVAVAVDDLLGLGRSHQALAEACVRAETVTVGAPTGGLDQSIAMHAEAAHALLVDFASGRREQVPFDPGRHGRALLVVDTRVSHELTDGGYGSRRDECDEAARLLEVDHLAAAGSLDGLPEPLGRRARHVVSEVRRVDEFVEALRADDWDRLGPLMNASHASLRDDFEVSCEELDVVVETARAVGAEGARMTGGGFGGSAIALVPADTAGRVREAVAAEFAERGWKAPEFFLAEPGPGATVA
jgi:galactokinase